MSKRLFAAFFGVLAIAVIGAGCGSSDSGSSGGDTSSATALTKPEFIKAADAVCEEANESINGEAEEFAKENGVDTKNPTTEQQEEVVSQVVAPALRDQAEKIDALGAPSGEEEAVEEIVTAVEAGADEAENDPGTLIEGKGATPFKEAQKLAKEFGLKVCGQG